MSSDSYNTLLKENVNIEAAASGSIWGLTMKADTKTA
jgi:hypothetical protein